jgi:hypothetical protein
MKGKRNNNGRIGCPDLMGWVITEYQIWELEALRFICTDSFSYVTLFFRWRMGNAQEWNMPWFLTLLPQLLDLHNWREWL